MLQAIGISVLNVLEIMGWMGIILFLLATVNTVCSMTYNISTKKESFSWKRLFKGLGKTALFYGSSIFVAIAFTIIPYINEMVTKVFGQMLIDSTTLENLSGIGVLGVCVAVILNQGKKAYEGIMKLGDIKGDSEEITWTVEEE